MDALIYARVSTKEQEESGYSLPAQKKILQEYCEKKDLNPLRIFSVAESASGKQERLIFKEMLEHARKKKIKNLVFEKVDRAARNFKEAVALNEWLEEDDERKIHSVKDSLVMHKGSTSQEKLNWGIRIVLAKNYTDNLSEEVKKGQKEKVSQGEFPGMPPLGYRSEGPRGHRTHHPDEKVAPYIQKMFKLYASGLYSTEKLAKIMEKDGLRSRFGNVIKKRLIWEMLNNPYYIGKFRWNGKYHKGNHEPLVSEELFNIVQSILHKRAVNYTSKKDFLFKGMMNCAKCGSRIGWEEHKGHVYGHCNYKYKNCDQREWMREDKVFEEIAEELGALVVKNPRISEWIKQSLELSHLEDSEYKENKITELQANYKRLDKRLDRLYEDRLDELISDSSYKERFARFSREKEDIQKEISRLSEESKQQQLIGVKVFQRAEVAQEKFRIKTPDVQRKILKNMCETVTVLNGKPQIEYTIAMQTLRRAVKATNESSEIKKIAENENNFSEPVNFCLTKAKTGSLEPACDIWRSRRDSNPRPPP